jgi:hypothetical protein
VSTGVFFRAQKHKNAPFPPEKRCLFLFRCARSRGGLHIKIKHSFKHSFFPSSPLLLEWLYLGLNAKLTILPYHRNNDGKKGRVFFGRERCVLCFCARKKNTCGHPLSAPKSVYREPQHKTKPQHTTTKNERPPPTLWRLCPSVSMVGGDLPPNHPAIVPL